MKTIGKLALAAAVAAGTVAAIRRYDLTTKASALADKAVDKAATGAEWAADKATELVGKILDQFVDDPTEDEEPGEEPGEGDKLVDHVLRERRAQTEQFSAPSYGDAR